MGGAFFDQEGTKLPKKFLLERLFSKTVADWLRRWQKIWKITGGLLAALASIVALINLLANSFEETHLAYAYAIEEWRYDLGRDKIVPIEIKEATPSYVFSLERLRNGRLSKKDEVGKLIYDLRFLHFWGEAEEDCDEPEVGSDKKAFEWLEEAKMEEMEEMEETPRKAYGGNAGGEGGTAPKGVAGEDGGEGGTAPKGVAGGDGGEGGNAEAGVAGVAGELPEEGVPPEEDGTPTEDLPASEGGFLSEGVSAMMPTPYFFNLTPSPCLPSMHPPNSHKAQRIAFAK